jgi:hypothetical protein
MKYRKVSRGRRMSTWKGNRNGSGNSKFKTRHRKMRGGATGATVSVDGIQLFGCSVPESYVGGPDYNQPDYDMHASEETNPSPNTPSIKEHNGTTVNTVFTGNTMKMGLFNRRSIFTSGPKHLHTLGLIQVITDNENCNISAQCSPIFYKNDTGVIHSKTKYVFFGQLDAKGNKHGWGICYDVSTPTAGRIFIGYWKDGKMYGLGIEVDFKYNTANNTHEPVGIYYGHFYQGKRHSYGIYYDINVDPNGKETLFHTQRDGKTCMLLDKSFEKLPPKEKTRHENKFTTMCISSLSFNSILQGIDEYTDFCFEQLNLAIGITSTLVKREHGDKGDNEYYIFQGYVKEYQKFVDFCRSLLLKALKKYYDQKNKDTIEAEIKKKEKAEKLKTAKELANENYFTGFTGEIVDPDEEAVKKEKIESCKNFLTELKYKIQTPDEIREKEEEEKEKKLAQHAELTRANSDLEKLKNELAIISQGSKLLRTNPNSGQNFYSSLSRSNRGRRSFRNHFNSSSSSRSSDNSGNSDSSYRSPLLLESLMKPQRPAGTATPETLTTSLKSPGIIETLGGGGNLTRKNMRTNKRKKTRKFRKSRRGGRR